MSGKSALQVRNAELVQLLSSDFARKATPSSYASGLNWFNVRSYGASPSATAAANSAAFQACIDAVRTGGVGGTIYVPGGTYNVDETLDITNCDGIVFRGDDWYLSIIHSKADGKPAFDICGSRFLTFRDIRIDGDGTDTPTVAFLMARTTVSNAGQTFFDHICVVGSFSAGGFYNFSTERNLWDDCFIYLSGCATTEFGIYMTAYNDYSYTSAFATILDTHSCSVNFIERCNIECFDSDVVIPIILSNAVNEITIRDVFLAYSELECDIKILGDHLHITIENVYVESLAEDVIVHDTYPGGFGRIDYLRIINCGSDNYSHAFFYGKTGTIVSLSTIENLRGGSGTSQLNFATIENSVVRSWWVVDNVGGFFADVARYCQITVTLTGYTITNSTFNIINTEDNVLATFYLPNKALHITGGWNDGPLIMGSYYLWVDATGDLRIKSGAPANDTDGVVVGSQS